MSKCISQVNLRTGDLSTIELTLTQLLVPEIREVMPIASPFEVEHGPYEFETLVSPQAQPPQYDLAFIPRRNRRIMWPVEAKVLQSPTTSAPYVQEVRDNFLTCRYAPFAADGAMLAYLLRGEPSKLFVNVEKNLQCTLSDHPDFLDRNHKTSEHKREVPTGKPYPAHFRCHHLILAVGRERVEIELHVVRS